MAKSLRSKWRRKCRAVKRIRYGEKELARLKKTLGIDENKNADTAIQDLSEVANVVTTKTMTTTEPASDHNEEKMDDGTVQRVYNPKTMRDQFGNYPIWMNKRRLLKKKNQNKVKNTKKQQRKNKRKN